MRPFEAYTPAQVRACGRMIKATLAKGGQIEDILASAAFAEEQGKNPVFWKTRFILPVPEGVKLDRVEVLGAYGYETLRIWIKIAKRLATHEIEMTEVKKYLREERRKDLASTNFGRRKG